MRVRPNERAGQIGLTLRLTYYVNVDYGDRTSHFGSSEGGAGGTGAHSPRLPGSLPALCETLSQKEIKMEGK